MSEEIFRKISDRYIFSLLNFTRIIQFICKQFEETSCIEIGEI